MKRIIILIICLALSSAALAAESGLDILRRSLDLSAAIRDYSAEVVVVTDLPGLQVPRRTATVYYKRPDKVAVKSKGVVMLPKRALMPGNIGTQISKDTTVQIIGKSNSGGVPVYALKIIPTSGGSGRERVLVWVRGDRFTIERMEVYDGPKKVMGVTWTHQLIGGKHWMPHVISAQLFDFGRSGGKREGTVSATFSKVTVNTGLSDELFKETKK